MLNSHAIISEARSWIGTRFHHQGRVKKQGENGGGCDCIGLVVGVLDALQVTFQGRPIASCDVTGYAAVPKDATLYHSLASVFTEIPVTDMAPGHIVLFRFTRYPQHVGFIATAEKSTSPTFTLIHSLQQAGSVVEHHWNAFWQKRLVAVFRV